MSSTPDAGDLVARQTRFPPADAPRTRSSATNMRLGAVGQRLAVISRLSTITAPLLAWIRPGVQASGGMTHAFTDGPLITGSRRYVALWLALTCLTTIAWITPDLPSAVYEPRLSIAIGSVSAVVGLALLQLGVFRFRVLGRPIDLYAGLAFGALAVSNLFGAWAPVPAVAEAISFEQSTWFLLLTRSIAGVLFLCGLSRTALEASIPYRPTRCGQIGILAATLLGVLAIAVLIFPSDRFPALLAPDALELVRSHRPVDLLLPGQHLALVMANRVLAIGLFISAIGYTAMGQRLRDPHIAALAGGLILLFFAQLNAVLVPAIPAEYVTTGDLLRLVAYVLLLSSLMWRTAQEFAASASQSERLRLSRELHDGLAQQLAVLQLRLGRVSETIPASDPRSRDVELARHVLDSISLEARGAITVLRSDRIAWRDLERVLIAFAGEFSLSHEVEARICTDSSDGLVDSQVQLDVLRILQEAFSNAARHGHAKQIEATLTHENNGLHLTVTDDGTGFDLAHIQRGIGLHSMKERVERRGGTLRVQSAEGQGTKIEAHLQLRARNGRPI